MYFITVVTIVSINFIPVLIKNKSNEKFKTEISNSVTSISDYLTETSFKTFVIFWSLICSTKTHRIIHLFTSYKGIWRTKRYIKAGNTNSMLRIIRRRSLIKLEEDNWLNVHVVFVEMLVSLTNYFRERIAALRIIRIRSTFNISLYIRVHLTSWSYCTLRHLMAQLF